MGLCEHPVWSRLSANQSRNICLLSWLVRRAVINGRGVVSASWVWSSESTLCRLSLLPSPLIEVANSSCLARCRILTAPPGKPCLSHKSLLILPQISPLPSCPVCTLTPCLEPGLALADVAWIVPLLCARPRNTSRRACLRDTRNHEGSSNNVINDRTRSIYIYNGMLQT